MFSEVGKIYLLPSLLFTWYVLNGVFYTGPTLTKHLSPGSLTGFSVDLIRYYTGFEYQYWAGASIWSKSNNILLLKRYYRQRAVCNCEINSWWHVRCSQSHACWVFREKFLLKFKKMWHDFLTAQWKRLSTTFTEDTFQSRKSSQECPDSRVLEQHLIFLDQCVQQACLVQINKGKALCFCILK